MVEAPHTLVKPSVRELQRVAAERAFLAMQPKLDSFWRSHAVGDSLAYDQTLERLRDKRADFLRTRESEPRLWEEIANKEIERRAWELPKESDDYASFVQMIAEAAIEVLSVEIGKREGRFNERPTSPVVIAGLDAAAAEAEPGEKLLDLFERYAAQRLAEKRKRPDTINQDRKVVEGFAAFVGATRSVRSIQPSDIRDWRDAIAKLPVKYQSTKLYVGLSIKEAVKVSQSVKANSVSPTTVNKYLSTISPFIAWCITNGYADRNPCDGLFYDIPKGKNPRPPFTSEQLGTIFGSPLFKGFLADGKEHIAGDQTANDWRFWIPTVCLFTGARIGEIAQLNVDDLDEEGGVLFMLIRHDESRGQRTKSGLTRCAPIHSRLIELGFLEFAKEQRERSARDGDKQLFPDLKANARGHVGAAPSRFWRDYLRRIGIKGKRDGIGAHSFRHTIADCLRQVGYLDDEIEVCLGHNQKTVTAGYGRIRQGTVGRLSKMIESVGFPEIHLKPRYKS